MLKERETNHHLTTNLVVNVDFCMSFSVLGHLHSVLMHRGSVFHRGSFLLTISFMIFPQVVAGQTLQSNQKVALEL